MKKFTTKEKRALTLSGSAGTTWAEAWAGTATAWAGMAWDGDDMGWEMREMRAWRGEI